MTPKEKKEIAAKYGLTVATVRNWLKLELPEWPIPWDDPQGMVRWFRARNGREPKAAFIERCAELVSGAGDTSPQEADDVAEVAQPAEHVPAELPPAAEKGPLEAVLSALELDGTLGRVLDEEGRLHARWKELESRDRKGEADAVRRDWLKLLDAKRAIHKTPDAVKTALGVLKDWVRRDWEPRQKDLRKRLSVKGMGAEIKAAAERGEDWETAWERELDAVLVEWMES